MMGKLQSFLKYLIEAVNFIFFYPAISNPLVVLFLHVMYVVVVYLFIYATYMAVVLGVFGLGEDFLAAGDSVPPCGNTP